MPAGTGASKRAFDELSGDSDDSQGRDKRPKTEAFPATEAVNSADEQQRDSDNMSVISDDVLTIEYPGREDHRKTDPAKKQYQVQNLDITPVVEGPPPRKLLRRNDSNFELYRMRAREAHEEAIHYKRNVPKPPKLDTTTIHVTVKFKDNKTFTFPAKLRQLTRVREIWGLRFPNQRWAGATLCATTIELFWVEGPGSASVATRKERHSVPIKLEDLEPDEDIYELALVMRDCLTHGKPKDRLIELEYDVHLFEDTAENRADMTELIMEKLGTY